MPEFKDMLFYLRKRADLTQSQLSAATGIGRGAISMYEAGRREPNFETLEIFADYFNVNIDTIMGREQPAGQLTDELDEELIRRLLLLTPEEREKVDAFVQGLLASR